jgi:hypothetical protein
VADRGITVAPTTNSKRRSKDAKPPHRAYVAALKQADAARTFPFFFDLPPEQRNAVYEELLVLHDSYTCHPQILATCKQIKDEASNVLYGDNLIEICLGPWCRTNGGYGDRVTIHGLAHRSPPRVWPAWLRKIQFLRITAPDIEHILDCPRVPRDFKIRSAIEFDSTMHSLCSSLAIGHKLRSFDVSITAPVIDTILDAAPTFARLPGLLGPVNMGNMNHLEESQSAQLADLSLETAMDATWTLLMHLFETCLQDLTTHPSEALDSYLILDPFTTMSWSEYEMMNPQRQLDIFLTIKTKFNDLDVNEVARNSMIRDAMQHLRSLRGCLFDYQVRQGRGNHEVRDAMIEFLMAEIDLRAARQTAG